MDRCDSTLLKIWFLIQEKYGSVVGFFVVVVFFSFLITSCLNVVSEQCCLGSVFPLLFPGRDCVELVIISLLNSLYHSPVKLSGLEISFLGRHKIEKKVP